MYLFSYYQVPNKNYMPRVHYCGLNKENQKKINDNSIFLKKLMNISIWNLNSLFENANLQSYMRLILLCVRECQLGRPRVKVVSNILRENFLRFRLEGNQEMSQCVYPGLSQGQLQSYEIKILACLWYSRHPLVTLDRRAWVVATILETPQCTPDLKCVALECTTNSKTSVT